jgi:hypothetical protein
MGNDVSSKLTILQESLLYIWVVWNRHVYLDGLQHNVETRHSLVLCLMMCPIGIISHLLTKVCIYLYICIVVEGHWIYMCDYHSCFKPLSFFLFSSVRVSSFFIFH